MTTQRNPVYHSIVTSKPPQEDGPIGHATERIFLPLIKILVPDIVDMSMPEPGVFHNCLVVSIRKRYPKHAQKVMNAIWGAHLLSLTKLIVVVDDDCDPADYHEVAFRAFGNVDYAHDLLLTAGSGRPPRPRVVPAVLGRQGRPGRDPQAAERGLPPGLAGRGRDVARDRGQGGPPVEGVRPVSAEGTSERRVAERAGRAAQSRRTTRQGRGRFLRLVAIEHSVFALPFAYLAALTAMTRRHRPGQLGRPRSSSPWRWSGARTFAMAANRVVDRHIDARNPRTARRELVTGAVSVRTAWIGAAVALAVFLVAAAALNPLCLALAPLALVPLVGLPVRQALHRLAARDPGRGPADRPGGRVARRDRHARRLRAGLGARRRRWGCGSAGST